MGKIAFLFSTQGNQYPGMMKDLYDEYQVCRDVFDKADEVLGRSISRICFEGTPEEQNISHNSQPCCFTADMAAYAVIDSYGIKPDVMAGFSMGEWAAVTAAGCVSLEDAFRIVQVRGDCVQKAVPLGVGAMAFIKGKTEAEILEMCALATEYVEPCTFSYPGQISITGYRKAVDEVLKIAEERGIVAGRLDSISYPSHCKLMLPARDILADAVKPVAFKAPSCPVYSNATSRPTRDASEIKRNAIEQLVMPVHFENIIRSMLNDGVDVFVELGTGKSLTGFVKKIAKHVGCEITMARTENIERMGETITTLRTN